jgi:hypothetical protein
MFEKLLSDHTKTPRAVFDSAPMAGRKRHNAFL